MDVLVRKDKSPVREHEITCFWALICGSSGMCYEKNGVITDVYIKSH